MVKDLFIKTDLDDKYTDASLQLNLKIKNQTAQPAKIKIRYSLFNKNEQPVQTATFENKIKDTLNKTITQNLIDIKI